METGVWRLSSERSDSFETADRPRLTRMGCGITEFMKRDEALRKIEGYENLKDSNKF